MKYHGDVIEFLKRMKHNIELRRWTIIPRRKNNRTVLIMPYSLVKKILLNLKTSNWYKGPEKDIDPRYPGWVWMFRKDIDSNEGIYIKIKLIHNKTFTKVISFHFD